MRIDEIEARAKSARVSLGYRRVLAEPILDDVALLVAFVREVEARHVPVDDCGNAQHTNFEVGCPDCLTVCAVDGEDYPCPDRQALDRLNGGE